MKRKIILSSIIIGMTSLFSCEKVFMHSSSKVDNISIFNEYTKLCKDKFALEDVKGVDIHALTDSIRPFITNELSKEDFFAYLTIITERMREGHTQLSDPKDYNFSAGNFLNIFGGYPPAISSGVTKTYYYGPEANPNVQTIGSGDNIDIFPFWYGRLPQNKDIGYMRIPSFDIVVSNDEIKNMMSTFTDAKGLIIDIRSNLGGQSTIAAELFRYFINQPTKIGTNYMKNGPGKNDFAENPVVFNPSQQYYFNKKVVLLHDRVSFSTSGLLTVYMKSLGNVISIGQRSGGGTGQIIDGFLSNGWKYVLSTSNLVNDKGLPTDNGYDPDIVMKIDFAKDTIQDPLIERAIKELQ